MKLVYIAGPYRRTQFSSQFRNIEEAENMALEAIKGAAYHGWFPVTPHLNTREFDCKLPAMSADYWLAGTKEMMARCDAVLLTRPDAAEVSEGTALELEYAVEIGLPVYAKLEDFIAATKGDPSHPEYFNSCVAPEA